MVVPFACKGLKYIFLLISCVLISLVALTWLIISLVWAQGWRHAFCFVIFVVQVFWCFGVFPFLVSLGDLLVTIGVPSICVHSLLFSI